MKKLFLSSYFAFVSDFLIPLLPKPAKELKLAFITTAADPYKVKLWLYVDKLKLKLMGFKIFDLDIKNKNEKTLLEELKNIDVIFVSGGNTYYLLEKSLQSGFDKVVKKLINRGVIYIGSSAGSVLTCPTIEHIEGMDDQSITNLSNYTGLNLIDFLILPHYGDQKYMKQINFILSKWHSKYKIISLTNMQAVVVEGTSYKIVESKNIFNI